MNSKTKTYVIQDWAGNLLNHNGNFVLPCFAVCMEFACADDAFEYVAENIHPDDHQDVFVEVL